MREVYSTASLQGDKGRGWRAIIDALYVPVDIDISAAPNFSGEIRRSTFAALELTEFLTDGELAHRNRRHIAHDDTTFFFFVLARAGALNYTQYDRECTVRPGHFTLIHSSSPYTFEHRNQARALCLKIPAVALCSRVADPHRLCGVAQPIRSGIGRVTAGVLANLAVDADQVPLAAATRIESNILDFMGLLLEAGSEAVPGTSSSTLWAIQQRSLAIMRSRYSEPGLDPAVVAHAVGVSVRYLHKAFKETEATFGEELLGLRLQRSWEDLANPEKAHLSIKQIAFRNGFANQSHFSNAFRAKFAAAPRDVRRQRVPDPGDR
jgi:AraC-like DNA-binding protein